MSTLTLIEAIKKGDLDTVNRLLNDGLSPDSMDDKGRTLVWHAAENGNIEIIHRLIENGANVNLSDIYDMTPIDIAAARGHLDIVILLIERGALYHAPAVNVHPLASAALTGRIDIIRYFIAEKKVPINDMGRFTGPPLQQAASEGHIEVVRYLIENGADPSLRDPYGKDVPTTVSEIIKTKCGKDIDKYNIILNILSQKQKGV